MLFVLGKRTFPHYRATANVPVCSPPSWGDDEYLLPTVKFFMLWHTTGEYALLGTVGVWFVAGIFVGSSLGVLFAAIARMGSDWE